MARKRRARYTEEDKGIILNALQENAFEVRKTWRALNDAGHNYGRGRVGELAKKMHTDEDVRARLIATEARVSALEGKLSYMRKLYGDSLKINDNILAAVQSLPKPRPVKIVRSMESQTDTPACCPIADWHIGEVVDEGEMEGFNKFNLAIARARVEYLSRKVADWVSTERHGHVISELHIPIMGDMVSGSIHEELLTYAEFTVPEAAVHASRLIADFISYQTAYFEKIHVHVLKVDNHSRLTMKKGSKRRGTNSWNHVIVELVELMLKDHGIEWHAYDSAKAEIRIGDWTLLADHGDGVTAYMGLPWYGFAREDGREAVKRMRENRPFDDRIRAHWHQAAAGPFGILCGCLCGSTELDAQAGRHSRPYQVSFLVHPKHGWYNFCRWDLSRV